MPTTIARTTLTLLVALTVTAGSLHAAAAPSKNQIAHARDSIYRTRGLTTAGWILGGSGTAAAGAAFALGAGDEDEASAGVALLATSLFGVGVPLAGAAGGWARSGCKALKAPRLSIGGRVTGWIFYGTAMAFGLAAAGLGFAEVDIAGDVAGAVALVMGIGALVLLEIDAHAHLTILQAAYRDARRKSERPAPTTPAVRLAVTPLGVVGSW